MIEMKYMMNMKIIKKNMKFLIFKIIMQKIISKEKKIKILIKKMNNMKFIKLWKKE